MCLTTSIAVSGTVLADAFELAMTLFATAEEIALESLRRGESMSAEDAIQGAIYSLRPDEDEQLQMWAAIQAASDHLSMLDVVVLSRAA